jgi:hypothetical protein
MAEVRRKCAEVPQDGLVARAAGMLEAATALRRTKALHAASGRPCAHIPLGYHRPAMTDQTPTQQPLDQQLQEIGAQLAWVRDYL